MKRKPQTLRERYMEVLRLRTQVALAEAAAACGRLLEVMEPSK